MDWFVKRILDTAIDLLNTLVAELKAIFRTSYYDMRVLFVYSFSFYELGGFLDPHTGIGYRSLFDNQAGQMSSGENSYDRSSKYVYLPIGVTHRMKINDVHKIETNFEYDYLIQGTQASNLSQGSPLFA